MTLRKKLLLATATALVIALLTVTLMPSPLPVSVTMVEHGHFAETVSDEGRTRLRDPYSVAAPITGFLRRVMLEAGDEVRSGDVLFQLESLPAPALDARAREQAREALSAARARLEAAEAQLETRRAEFAVAESEYQRSEQLHERQLISSEERDRRRAARDTARAAERAARHSVEAARFEMESARATLEIADGERAPGDQPLLDVRSPIAGTVTARYRCCEGPIQAGERVLQIGDLTDDLEVQVDLLSMDAVRVRPGMRVIIERWGGDEDLEGRVRRVEPAGFKQVSALGVDEQRVPVWVTIESERTQWATLGDGYRVEARFVLWEHEDVIHIPTSALFRREDRWVAFVVEGDRARLRQITPGRHSGLRTQILAGLEPGEIVITHPGARIADGTRVAAELR